MKKSGVLLVVLLTVSLFTLPAQAAPLMGTWESPEFAAGDWKEILYGGGEGQQGNEIQAFSPPFFRFAGAILQSVQALGIGDCSENGGFYSGTARRYKTIYSGYSGGNGGLLVLGNIAGNPWYNPADSHTRFPVALGPSEVYTCKYVGSDGTTETGEISFELKSTGNFLNDPGYIAKIEARYKGSPTVTPPTASDPAAISGALDWAKIAITGPVSVDIKPGSCPNPINVKSRGVLPVAILGSANFDVREIDTSTIRMLVGNAEIEPLRWNYEDVATPYLPPMLPRHRLSCNTLGPDGFEDLNLKFKTQDVIEAMGNLGNDKRVFWTLELKFNLLDGTALQGTDVVVFLNNQKK